MNELMQQLKYTSISWLIFNLVYIAEYAFFTSVLKTYVNIFYLNKSKYFRLKYTFISLNFFFNSNCFLNYKILDIRFCFLIWNDLKRTQNLKKFNLKCTGYN